MNLIGRSVGQYRIVEPIGQGGMATVYKAYQPALERFVAIKLLPTRHAIANGFSERFEREARAVAQLNHPNILPILDFGQEDDFSFIVMKLVSSGTLKDQLGKAIELSEVAHIIEQIAAGLDHAHERGILHRDVKPSNILLDENNWVQLTDFGLAKMMAGDEGLTASGVGIGTPAYMSPEQGQGLTVDHRTDIYSLGVVLYETVTGRLPYRAETPMAIIFKHIYEPLTLPRLIRPELPPVIEAVILKALEKKPKDRYASAGEMAQALREAVVISESGADVVVKSIISPVDAATSQPTLSLEERVADVVTPSPSSTTPVPEVTPPPEPPRPPEIEGFVGREEELTLFAEKLESLHLSVITGMPGVGKTTFAAKLVERVTDSDKIFWHSFHESEGVEAVIWKLAGFLYWRGQPDLWCMLQSTQQNGGQPPPNEVLLDYVIQMTRSQGYVLCLDDLHLVEDDSLLAQLAARLHQIVVTGELSLIIISRRIPEFVPTAEFEPLAGLNLEDTFALLALHGLTLPEELVRELFEKTEGNAQLLTLAIEALKRTHNPRRVIANLVETDDIERYLMSEVDAALTFDERAVMSTVSALLGYAGTRDAIETILGGGSTRRVLSDLTRRHLLTILPSEASKQYIQHATVRAFYYDLLGRNERQDMHSRAGAYYETEEPEILKAAVHYERAGKYVRAAQLATADVWSFINQGQLKALRQLLERFRAQQMDTQLWAAVNIARGEVYTFVREGQLARDSFQEALSSLATLEDSPEVLAGRAQACRGMGELLEYEAPQEALEWLHRGLAELDGANNLEKATLLMEIGSVQNRLSEYAAAQEALEDALELLPEQPHWIRAGVLTNLGNVHFYQGDSTRANEYTLQALEISQLLNDYYQMLLLQSNLGIDKQIAGDWEGAVTDHRQALALATQLGSVSEQVRIESNLGLLYTNRGDDDLAMTRIVHAMELARGHNLKEQLVHILSNLADLQLRQGEHESAKPMLAEAERLALELETKYQLPEIYRGWARAQLADGQPDAALMNAETAVDIARNLGLNLEIGSSLHVLGQALLADGQVGRGTEALEQCLALVVNDPYETARAKTTWGRILLSGTEQEQGRALLQEARETFATLGAKRDLASLDELLEA